MGKVDNNNEVPSFEALQKKYDELEKKHFKTVYWFWMGILIYFFLIAIAIMICFFCTESNGLIKYIGLVATLLSIVLSIFAIMFTYTANHQMSDKYHDISGAANDIRQTSSMTREELMSVRRRMDSIETRINQIQQVDKAATQNTEASQKQYIVNNVGDTGNFATEVDNEE